jgi:hypothetical protein
MPVIAPRTYSPMEPSMSPSKKRREGFALAIAMVAIVVIGALIAGAFFTSTQEYRIGRNSLMDQRALAAAETGLTEPMQGWLRTRNLTMNAGDTFTDVLPGPDGSYADRRFTKVDDATFWGMVDGYAGGTTGVIASHHRLNVIYRLAVPTFNIFGALTVRGQVEVQGSSRVDGNDEIPSQWTTSGICPLAGAAKAGVSAPDISKVCSGNCPESPTAAPRIFGNPAESENPAAADENTYYKYGDLTWDMLTAAADVKLPGGNYKTLPSFSGSSCNTADPLNWGDPGRTTECKDYFPIIYVNGNLQLQSNSRGQGVLLVNGDLEMAGGFEFNGIMIVRDDIKSTGNGNKISGAAFAGNTYTTDNTNISGDSEIQFSSCAIDRAARGSAVVTRAKQRGFAEVIQ